MAVGHKTLHQGPLICLNQNKCPGYLLLDPHQIGLVHIKEKPLRLAGMTPAHVEVRRSIKSVAAKMINMVKSAYKY